MDQFEEKILKTEPPTADYPPADSPVLELIPDPQFRRLKATVDLDLAAQRFNLQRPYDHCDKEEKRILLCCSDLKKRLDQLNHDSYNRGI